MRYTFFALFIILCQISSAQKNSDIVSIIDDLTIRWDESAIKLKNYQGIQEFCLVKEFRLETNELLDEIHHWDTTLYYIVQGKFDASKDEEAKATLHDIELLETEYSTQNFKEYIADECQILKKIQDSFDAETVKKYEKEIKKFEKELVKYITSITYRIDIIDEHIHHLNFN
ncbi:MAG: hypothetical protein AB8B73_00480 [Ekhidna sp.]